jgi:hypothetical protein
MGKFILVFLFFVVASCSKIDSNTPNAMFEVPIITGYKLLDLNGSPMGVVGNPNIKTELSSNGVFYRMVVYPIPSINFIGLNIDAPKDGSNRQIWIKKAQGSGTFSDNFNFGTLSMNANGNVFDTSITENELSILVSRFPKGYYRLYISIAGHRLYENIVINK